MSEVKIIGRSSSHFTRVTKIFAAELGVPYTFVPVYDLMSLDAATFAGNPAMKIPSLMDEQGPLFGSENICRELLRRSGKASSVVMRGDSTSRIVANMEEQTLNAMGTGVSLILQKASNPDAPLPVKPLRSIEQCLQYLDENIDAALAALPADRAFSFLEVAVFCLVEHLPFRGLLDVSPWRRLEAFRAEFAKRPSAAVTTYRVDVRPTA